MPPHNYTLEPVDNEATVRVVNATANEHLILLPRSLAEVALFLLYTHDRWRFTDHVYMETPTYAVDSTSSEIGMDVFT